MPETSIGFLSKRVFQAATAALEPIFVAEDTTYVQWSAMTALWSGRADTCVTLARELCHDTGATTRLIDALEAQGWVERSRSAEDRRIVLLSLTEAGQQLAERCRQGVTRQWNAWLSDWDAPRHHAVDRRSQQASHLMETGSSTCA